MFTLLEYDVQETRRIARKEGRDETRAEYEPLLASKDAELANKDAEIAALRAQLNAQREPN